MYATFGKIILYPLPLGARLLLGAAKLLRLCADRLAALAFQRYGEDGASEWPVSASSGSTIGASIATGASWTLGTEGAVNFTISPP